MGFCTRRYSSLEGESRNEAHVMLWTMKVYPGELCNLGYADSGKETQCICGTGLKE
jgi:hypothetical protein